jgi:drug/metabolite transporter (DMT)-like permease
MSRLAVTVAIPAQAAGPLAGLPLLLTAPALFAANMVAARWAHGADVPPVFMAFARWLVAFLVLAPLVAGPIWQHRHLLRANAGRLLLLGAMGMGVAVAPQYLAAQTTSAVNIGLIVCCAPVIIAMLEAAIWGQRLEAGRVLGLVLAFCGVLAILARGDLAALARLQFGAGDLWALLAAVGWSAYTLLLRHRPLPAMPETVQLSAVILGGAVALAPFALFEAVAIHAPDLRDWRLHVVVLFLAVVPSLGAYLAYGRVLARMGTGAASVALYLIPVWAGLIAWPFLGEAPRFFHLAGLGFILPGVALTTMPQATLGRLSRYAAEFVSRLRGKPAMAAQAG